MFFNDDDRADLAVIDSGVQSIFAPFESSSEVTCGGLGDIPVPGKYIADADNQLAVWNPSFGIWQICIGAALLTQPWGSAGDIPVPGDFNGDTFTDYAVFRPATGEWWILFNSNGSVSEPFVSIQFGLPGDTPVVGDFDGDGTDDIAVFRANLSSGGTEWYIRNSVSGATSVSLFGLIGDVPVVADYSGDGVSQIGVWRPSEGKWFYIDGGKVTETQFGLPGDIPSPADFDGVGKSQLLVYRPKNSRWFVQGSSEGSATVEVALGQVGARVANHSRSATVDRPAELDLNGDRLTDLGIVRVGNDNSLGFLFNTGTGAAHADNGLEIGQG
ncbi:hypothetical protein BVY02_01660, partial [bacterium J17]